MVNVLGVLVNLGSVRAVVEMRKCGVDGKVLRLLTTLQPVDLEFVTQTLEGDLCQIRRADSHLLVGVLS